jgi:NHLM bacteriocin system ABC transporter peptidase/ATP-binding protein
MSRRVNTPTILQMEAAESGAAALGIVLAYFGRVLTLEQLRLACGVSRDGSKPSNVAKAAEEYGLVVRSEAADAAGLAGKPLPLIALMPANTFAVVNGFRGDKVYLNDPSQGPTTMPLADFEKAFTGQVMTFRPGPDFVQEGRFPNIWSGLAHRFGGSTGALAFVVLVGLGLVVPGLLTPSFSRVFIDNVLVQGLAAWLRPLLLAMFGTAAGLLVLTWMQQYYLFRFAQKLTMKTSSEFLWHVLHLPVEFFSMRGGGDLATRVGLNTQIAQVLTGDLANTVLALITMFFYALLMVQYSIPLTILGIFFAGLNFVALRVISRKRVDANRRVQGQEAQLVTTTFAGMQMIETLKATGTISDFYARWAGIHANGMNARQELAVYTEYLVAVPVALAALSTAAVLSLGGEQVISGSLSIGALIAFQALMVSFSAPVNNMVNLGGAIQELEGNMIRLDDVLEYPVDGTLQGYSPSHDGQGPTRLTGELELRNVTFGYSRMDEPLISGFNLHLRPGARVAIVGGSGSGKSTLAKLVTGLYAPWSGDILFDDRPRTAYPRDVVALSLASVDQDVFMFEGTIAENLTLWDPTVPEQAYVQATKDACIHDVVAARAGGYDSHIEEGGNNFSGGQRQRLEIARALVNDPRIVVLDEATSALDAITEKIIDENLRERGCTCVIVAHRLSTIRDCDEIIVLDHGKVVQRGTHEELKDQEGLYAQLIAAE